MAAAAVVATPVGRRRRVNYPRVGGRVRTWAGDANATSRMPSSAFSLTRTKTTSAVTS